MSLERILICVSNDLRTDQRIQKITKAFSELGLEVTVLGFGREKRKEPFHGGKALVTKTWFSSGKLFYLELWIRLFFLIRKHDHDILWSCDADTLVSATLARQSQCFCHVFDAHEYFSETSGVVGRDLVQWIWKGIERKYIPRCDIGVTVSNSLSGILEERFGIRFFLLRNLPIMGQNLKLDKQDSPYWIYQGAINKGRGLENTIKAFHASEYKLKIAGAGPLKNELLVLVKKEGLGEKIEFLGNLHPEKLKEVTDQAFAGINIVDGLGLSYRYSLANKFFDYMQSGIPQLCSDLPEYREINEKYGFARLISDNSVEEIKKGIQDLEEDQNLRNRLSEKTIEARKELNWEREKKKLQDLLDEFKARKNSPSLNRSK